MTRYKCTDCGAEDSDHQDYTSPPAALVCYKCRAGGGMRVEDQVKYGTGMLINNNLEEIN